MIRNALHFFIGFAVIWQLVKNEERPSAKRQDAISNTERDIQRNRACSGANKKYEGQTVEFRSRDSIAVGQAVIPSEPEPWSDSLTANPGQRLTVPDSLTALTALSLTV